MFTSSSCSSNKKNGVAESSCSERECENMVEAAICCLSRDADLKGFRKDDVEKSKVIVIITYPILNKFFFM